MITISNFIFLAFCHMFILFITHLVMEKWFFSDNIRSLDNRYSKKFRSLSDTKIRPLYVYTCILRLSILAFKYISELMYNQIAN